MNALSRRAARPVATFFVLMIVLGWPLTSVRASVSEALAAVLSPLLESIEFGHGGHASLHARPVREVRRAGENVSSDAQVDLTVRAHQGTLHVGVNLRRDVYLPLLVFVAAVLSAPVAWQQRLSALLIGLPFAGYSCLFALYATVRWLFAHQAPAVYGLTSAELKWLDTLVSTFLMPPTLRFFVPLMLAVAALAVLGSFRSARSAALALPDERDARREQHAQ